MMRTLNYFIALSVILMVSCKKQRSADPEPTSETITINGGIYNTVKLGNQTWITENYHGPGGIAYSGTTAKPEYGKYYTFAEAGQITLPAGWRLPTAADHIALAASQNIVVTNYQAVNQDAIKKLTSTQHWLNVPGSNTSGFNAYPAGYMYNDATPMDGDISEFWASDGKTMSIQETAAGSLRLIFYDSTQPGYRFNVRFVKDN